jgi:NTP pyrophosphatase (non-canonical NTP hydrolase)
MTSLIERVARLLCQQHGGDPDAVATEKHDCWEGPLWSVFVTDAEAIQAAFTEPAAAMPGVPHWSRQEIVKTIIDAMVEADGKVKAAPAGKAADHILAHLAPLLSPSHSGETGEVEFLAQLRRINSERYEAWVTTTEPLLLCAHCGRADTDAASAESTHCNAPFDAREHEFTKPHPYLTRKVRSDAGIMFDALELGGEVGELLNVVKKLEREERGWRGSRAAPEDFADECADVLICLDKLARRRGVDLVAATVAKYNATSDKVGLPHKLATPNDGGRDDAKRD